MFRREVKSWMDQVVLASRSSSEDTTEFNSIGYPNERQRMRRQ